MKLGAALSGLFILSYLVWSSPFNSDCVHISSLFLQWLLILVVVRNAHFMKILKYHLVAL